ncbi:unnamed protein product [Adineta ricciae]|uniref:Uncharacterized protein n=1 Tax=Adineta ricciae TaxID=249248 RepID=A0A815C452_ADIRI|nr:unnamed protein product [Adineta ricciae]
MLTAENHSTITEQQIQSSPKTQFSIWQTFKQHVPRFIFTVLIDIVLPLLIYFALQKQIKPVYALLAASSPPLFMVIFKALWFWTFDALGFLVFLSFALSAVVAVITRNPIILLLEKSLVTGILSIIFAVTLVPLNCCHHRCRLRPIGYYFYQDLVPTTRAEVGLPQDVFNGDLDQNSDQYEHLKEENSVSKLSEKEEVTKVYEWIYKNCPSFRLACHTLTSIWAIGFFFEFIARLTLILLHLPVNMIFIYAHIILSSITVLCIILSVICITIERKHTLLFIERWNDCRQLRRTGVDNNSFAVIIERNLNSVTHSLDA